MKKNMTDKKHLIFRIRIRMFWEVWAGAGKKGPDPQYCSLNNLTEFFSGSDTNIKTQVRKVLLFKKKNYHCGQ